MQKKPALDNLDYQSFKKVTEHPGNVVVTTHYNPDGDAIGSSLALFHLLKNNGANVKLIVPNDIPAFLQWLPGVENAIVYEKEKEFADQILGQADVIYSIDYNSFHRVRLFEEKLSDSGAYKVLIDHHINPADTYDLILSTTVVSSTSELLFSLMENAGFAEHINEDIAYGLFVGIMTDTGSFSYSCSRPETFAITSKLIEKGIDIVRVHQLVYDTYSENRMRLLGFCLSERLKVFHEFSTAYIWLTKEDLEQFSYEPGDTEGIVNYALSIENITFAALFTERSDRIRISLRSKGDFSVNDVANQYFQGGGHKNAAGGDSFISMNETLAKFESILPLYHSALIENSTKVKCL